MSDESWIVIAVFLFLMVAFFVGIILRRPRTPISGEIIYIRAEACAKLLKGPIQMLIGIVLATLLFCRGLPRLIAILNEPSLLSHLTVLEIVGKGLAYSAGIELIYMLFTEGPDEALDPPMMGIAAAVLLVVSKIETPTLRGGFTVLLLVLAISALFGTEKYLFTRERA
jgi:hypothetical protein